MSYVSADAGTGFARETVTVDNTTGGVTLTAATYAPSATNSNLSAVRALITNETAQIRFTYDGTAPTTTLGHIMEAGQAIVLTGYPAIANFKAIRTGGTSGSLQVTYERN